MPSLHNLVNTPRSTQVPSFPDTLQRAPSPSLLRSVETPPPGANPLPGMRASAMGDARNLQMLAKKLYALADTLGKNATPQAVTAALNATTMAVHPHSSYPAQTPGFVSLEAFIRSIDVGQPSNHFHLTSLADAVSSRAIANPFGDFGGGLTWPVPLSLALQRQLLEAADAYMSGPQARSGGGILEFLNGNRPLSAVALDDPIHALETITHSGRAHAFGQALQSMAKGMWTETSINDYLLATLQLVLNPESLTQPSRNWVAGFDLAQSAHWGQPACAVVEGLAAHLVEKGRAGPEMAKVAAHLLLAKQAPEFLVKNIPASVAYGSPAWVRLAIAASTLEAQSPGSVATMSFDQVMMQADRAARVDPDATARAQKSALADWGVASGLLERKRDERYSDQQLNQLSAEYNAQLTEQTAVDGWVNTALPNRKEIALAKLKERYGENVPFEEKLLRVVAPRNQSPYHPLYNPNLVPEGLHSMLDIAMMENPHYAWTTKDERIPLDAINANPKLGVNREFNTRLDEAIRSQKKGLATTVKHLISQLPLEQRKDLEFGNIKFFHESSHRIGLSGETLIDKDNTFWIRTEREGASAVYQLDLKKGTLKKESGRDDISSKDYGIGTVQTQRTEFMHPAGSVDNQKERPPAPSSIPVSFKSDRTQYIAEAFVEHLEIDNADAIQALKGSTPLDKQHEAQQRAGHFFLDLFPFKSAITNFVNGNHVAGAIDLTIDLMGFLTLGAASAAKLGRISGSAVSKAIQAGKILASSAITAFNPLGGVDDLVFGGARALGKGARALGQGINQLRGASGSYDLLKAASQQYDLAALGHLKVADRNVEASAVFDDGHWYRYDPIKAQPYGPPLTDFKPSVTAAGGEVKAVTEASATEWLSTWFGSARANPDFVKDFDASRRSAIQADQAAYERGYDSGLAPMIADYSTSLSIAQIKRLSLQGARTPEEIGRLVRRIENLEELPNRFFTRADNLKLADAENFASGYSQGVAASIHGYTPTLTIAQLQEVALQPGRSTAELACLFKQIENKTLALNQLLAQKFSAELSGPGTRVILMPQGYYLSQVKPISPGQCAAFSNTVAYAFQDGKISTFIDNFFTAMANPNHLGTQNFRNSLQSFQSSLRTNFHGTQPTQNFTYGQIITELANAQTSKSLLISNGSGGHGISAGVLVNGAEKEWYYYDPNFGIARFSTEQAMRTGVERAMNSGATRHMFLPDPGTSAYKVSTFDEMQLMNAVGSIRGPYSLFEHPITLN